MTNSTPTLDDLPFGTVRKARKPWRCVCATRLYGYEIQWTNRDADGRNCGTSSSRCRGVTEAEAEVFAAEGVGAVSNVDANNGYKPSGWRDEYTITEWVNPNWTPERAEHCHGDIPIGERHFEYQSDAGPYQSGDRYCEPCALDAWSRFV